MFFFLIGLMSVSLIGIIAVQAYWIKKSFDSNAKQYSLNAKQALIRVAEQIEQREIDRYYVEYIKLADSKRPTSRTLSELFQVKKNDYTNETFIYSNSILQEDYKLETPFLKSSGDSIDFTKFTNRKVTRVIRQDESRSNPEFSAEEKFERISRLPEKEKYLLKNAIKEKSAGLPIKDRINRSVLKSFIQAQLDMRDISSKYEFAIYDGEMATGLETEGFSKNPKSTYGIALFASPNNDYRLLINFIGQKREVMSSIKLMLILSILFTLIIIFAYGGAIYLLQKQRKIAIIKSDFINNMTHEFKTPIATINLALDALKNKKLRADEGRLDTYLQMMRDENKRMHAQVESVLRISRLERNELNISKERLNLQELIEEAISHVTLIVEERNGYIDTHFSALNSSVLASESHFTNVIVNILDNAVKYSEDEPKIDIFTKNINDFVIVKIRDQGNGMSKSIQKKVFEKFFREHTGNIHNIKGHGLGLAYVKQIIADHHGEISIESEKGKGSTFIIKLPIIS